MSSQHVPAADGVTQARSLLAVAAQEVDRMEIEASEAFCRLTALTEMLARLERLAVSHEPDVTEAAALYAATICRQTEDLLRHISSREWAPFVLPQTAASGNGHLPA